MQNDLSQQLKSVPWLNSSKVYHPNFGIFPQAIRFTSPIDYYIRLQRVSYPHTNSFMASLQTSDTPESGACKWLYTHLNKREQTIGHQRAPREFSWASTGKLLPIRSTSLAKTSSSVNYSNQTDQGQTESGSSSSKSPLHSILFNRNP
jgi:hypothetical protein